MHSPAYYIRRIIANPRYYFRRKFVRDRWRHITATIVFRSRYTPAYLRARARNRRDRRIFFFPMRLGELMTRELYVAWKVLQYCGAREGARRDGTADLAIAWAPVTQYELDEARLRDVSSKMRVLNARCTDIRKSTVGRHFVEAFGYGLEVDPWTHHGPLLRKSEKNGPHDATILHGPLAVVEPGYVYQRIVTYETADGLAEWRTAIVDAKVASVYLNYRHANDRFRVLPAASKYTAVSEAFSAGELHGIERFCRSIGLDFGVLDILRDHDDGRIYISDCNPSPTGPGRQLSIVEQCRVAREISTAFEEAYFSPVRLKGARG